MSKESELHSEGYKLWSGHSSKNAAYKEKEKLEKDGMKVKIDDSVRGIWTVFVKL